MSENLSVLKSIEKAEKVFREREMLSLEIAALNKDILTYSSKKDEYQSNHATKMMVFAFFAVLAVLVGILVILLNQESFMNWFNLTFYGKTQVVFVVLVVLMLAIAAAVARLVAIDVMNTPFNTEKKVKKMNERKNKLTEKRKLLEEENKDLLCILPEDYQRSDVCGYLHNLMSRNPRLSLEEALEDYKKNEPV